MKKVLSKILLLCVFFPGIAFSLIFQDDFYEAEVGRFTELYSGCFETRKYRKALENFIARREARMVEMRGESIAYETIMGDPFDYNIDINLFRWITTYRGWVANLIDHAFTHKGESEGRGHLWLQNNLSQYKAIFQKDVLMAYEMDEELKYHSLIKQELKNYRSRYCIII